MPITINRIGDDYWTPHWCHDSVRRQLLDDQLYTFVDDHS
jgi:hypothetical protein